MPLCVHCANPLTCSCKKEQPIGESILGCPLSNVPGAIWVHVTDDIGRNLEKIPVLLFPETNSMGLSVRESLPAGKYSVELAPPEQSSFSETHDFPVARNRPVIVQNGAISYVAFLLKRKAKLLISVVFKSDRSPFQEPGVEISMKAAIQSSGPPVPDRKAVKGVADFGLLSAGGYEVTPSFTGVDAEKFDFETGPKSVPLSPGDAKSIEFEVVRRAHLKVEIVFKRAKNSSIPRKLLEDPAIAFSAQRQGASSPLKVSTAKGIADFGWVTPGSYTITPDFSPLKECEYDYTSDPVVIDLDPAADKTVEFEVEPLYQKVQFIAHSLMTIPNQIYQFSAEDLQDRVTVGNLNGKRTFTFKNKRVKQGMWTKSELKPPVPFEKGVILAKPDGSGTLTLKKKKTDVTFWTLNDLDPATLDPQKVAVVPTIDPNKYDLQFQPMYADMPCDRTDLTGQWMANYHGHADDRADINARVAFIKDTLQKAFAKAKTEADVLKVFLIPECFFQGLYGAYLNDDAEYLIGELEKLVQGEEWKDWVFGFGTINTVFPAAPMTGIAYSREIFEMTNRAPVIRGGLGAGPGSTRLIRKVLNSAELADDLVPEPLATKRERAINQYVQFAATEDEIKGGKLLTEILEKEKLDGSPGIFFGTKSLPADWWRDSAGSGAVHGLFEEMVRILGEWGLARVIREIQISNNEGVDGTALNGWRFSANESSSVNRKTCLLTIEQATLLLIQAQWRKEYGTEPLMEKTWVDDSSGKRAKVLSGLTSDFENVALQCGFRLTCQKVPIQQKIEELVNSDVAAKDFVKGLQRLLFRPGVFPLWRKLLELYAAEKKDNAPLKYSKESFKLEDYCFAGPRKPGPWFASLAEAKQVKSCKRMVFGLEICADHANDRLSSINKGTGSIDIDVQLVPSAGMRPVYFAARKEGYIFNCDGWNKKSAVGGDSIEIHLDGPSPWTYTNDEGYDVDVSPIYPHSALGKRLSDATNVGASLERDKTVISDPLSAHLSNVIFGNGPGELHFYPLQDLPK